MTPADGAIADVLAAWPMVGRARSIQLAGAGGFSGARVWRLETEAGPLCLRQWPARGSARERLEFIQAVLRHTAGAGLPFVPAPIATCHRTGFIVREGRFWELTRWLPGNAADGASPAQLRVALAALAQFHLAASAFSGADREPRPSPGIAERIERLTWLWRGGRDVLRAAICPADWPALAPRAERLLRLFEPAAPAVERLLAEVAAAPIPILPAIRDIRREHVLLVGDEVTGLVDYGAMRLESPAADVARLLGSLVGDDASAWNEGLAAYERERPLTAAERRLAVAFDRSFVLLAGTQWLEWIFVEGRVFADRPAVERRLDEILGRLEILAG